MLDLPLRALLSFHFGNLFGEDRVNTIFSRDDEKQNDSQSGRNAVLLASISILLVMQPSWNFASWAEPSRAGFFRAEPSWQSFRSELSRAGVFKKWAITSWSRAENSFINNKVFQVNTSKGGGRYWKVVEKQNSLYIHHYSLKGGVQ